MKKLITKIFITATILLIISSYSLEPIARAEKIDSEISTLEAEIIAALEDYMYNIDKYGTLLDPITNDTIEFGEVEFENELTDIELIIELEATDMDTSSISILKDIVSTTAEMPPVYYLENPNVNTLDDNIDTFSFSGFESEYSYQSNSTRVSLGGKNFARMYKDGSIEIALTASTLKWIGIIGTAAVGAILVALKFPKTSTVITVIAGYASTLWASGHSFVFVPYRTHKNSPIYYRFYGVYPVAGW